MPDTRIIKRYANRKLYDTEHSRYVTLDQISEMIRNGDDVKIVDNKTKEDLTTVTLAQIIFEEEKKQRSLPAARRDAQHHPERRRVVRRGAAPRPEHPARQARRTTRSARGPAGGRSRPTIRPTRPREKKQSLAALREWVDHSKHRLEEWQKQVDAKSAARSRASSTRSIRGPASTRTSRRSPSASPSSRPSFASSKLTKTSQRALALLQVLAHRLGRARLDHHRVREPSSPITNVTLCLPGVSGSVWPEIGVFMPLSTPSTRIFAVGLLNTCR